jgi:CelD/BcsL family acetyltransferase involved in cellulose biosynthesis
MAMNYEIITSLQDFLKLRDAWNALVEKCPGDHAYLRHEWYECWLKYLGRPKDMTFVLVRERSDLVAAAPMQLSRTRIKGLPLKVLTFASSGMTPRNTFLISGTADETDLFDFISKQKGYDLLLANQMDAETDTTRLFLNYQNNLAKGRPVIEEGRQSPYLTTEDGWETYWSSLTGSLRRNLRKMQRLLGQTGETKIVKIEQYETLKLVLPELFRVSSKSWKADDGTDLGSLPHIVKFVDEFSRISEKNNSWEVWLLRINGKAIAYYYYLCSKNRLSGILTNFDREYRSFSPGKLLQLAVLEDMFSRTGVWEYDMGGQAYDYKLRWTQNIRKHISIWTDGPGIYGKLLMFGKRRILPLLASIRSSRDEN